MQVSMSAIERGSQTLFTNFVDAALLEGIENGLLDSALEARLRITNGSDLYMNATGGQVNNNKMFITHVEKVNEITVNDWAGTARLQNLLQIAEKHLDIGQKHETVKVLSPPLAHHRFQHHRARNPQSLIVTRSFTVGSRNGINQRGLLSCCPILGFRPIPHLPALAPPSKSFTGLMRDTGLPWATTPMARMMDDCTAANRLLGSITITRRTRWCR